MTDVEAKARLLENVAIFDGIGASALADIQAQLTWCRVLPGQSVVGHLDRSTSFFIVLEGEVRVRILATTGREVAFRIIGAGGHFGEIAALTGAPRIADVTADTPALLGELSGARFSALMTSYPTVSSRLLVALARNVAFLTDRVFELSALGVRARICAELLRRARDGETDASGAVVISPSPTQTELANIIGSQREAVTRDMRMLVAEGLIRTKRSEIAILDMDRLRALVEGAGGVTATHLVDWSL